MTSGIRDASANCGNGANPKSSDEMGIEHIGGSHAANCGNCANREAARAGTYGTLPSKTSVTSY